MEKTLNWVVFKDFAPGLREEKWDDWLISVEATKTLIPAKEPKEKQRKGR